MGVINVTKNKKDIIVDCHYCEEAACISADSGCNCYNDFGYFDHTVEDSKREAEECPFFRYCDIFPKD